MTKFRFAITLLFLCPLTSLLLAAAETETSPLCFKVQLIWGSSKPKPNDPELKEADVPLQERLKKLLKWERYFEIKPEDNKVPLCVAAAKTEKRRLSSKCEIELKNLGKRMIELKFYGEGKLVWTVRQAVAKDLLVFAGDDKDDSAWFVVLTPK